jgi:hypothetical protein
MDMDHMWDFGMNHAPRSLEASQLASGCSCSSWAAFKIRVAALCGGELHVGSFPEWASSHAESRWHFRKQVRGPSTRERGFAPFPRKAQSQPHGLLASKRPAGQLAARNQADVHA